MADTNYFSAPDAIYMVSGADPTGGTDEVQTLTAVGTVTAGTFQLAFAGETTGPISWTANTSILETALNTLSSLGNGGTAAAGVAVTGGTFPGTALVVTFSGSNVRKKAHGLLTLDANNLDGGGSVTIAEGVAGVVPTASVVKVPKGALCIRTDTGTLFQNTGIAGDPTWASRT